MSNELDKKVLRGAMSGGRTGGALVVLGGDCLVQLAQLALGVSAACSVIASLQQVETLCRC